MWFPNVLGDNFSSQTAIEAVQTPISWSSDSDSLFWPFSKDGLFTIKSGYRRLVDLDPPIRPLHSTSTSIDPSLWKYIWSARVVEKVKHFVWKLCNNSLPLKEVLYKKRVGLSPMCPICHSERESVEHAFLLCNWTEPCWFAIQICSPPSRVGLTTIQDWIMDKLKFFESVKDLRDSFTSKLFYALWFIWKSRNEYVFSGTRLNPTGVVIQVNSHVLEFLFSSPRVAELKDNGLVTKSVPKWRAPPVNQVKINTDATFDPNQKTGTIGIILRDDRGTCLTASTRSVHCSSALMAEALGMRDGVLLARNLSLTAVIFESDNQQLIEVCRGNLTREEIKSITRDIRFYADQFQFCGFTWTPREGNVVAHNLALMEKLEMGRTDWLLRPSPSLRKVVTDDCINL